MEGTINYGIDLGTTNSAIAVYKNGEVEVFKNPSNLKQTLPSVIAFKGERIIIGDKAREVLKKAPQSVFGTFKRKMGTSDKYFVEPTGDFMSPTDLSAIVLKELKNFIHSGDNPEAVVITIPAAFDTMQSNATKKAGYHAGFSEVVLLQEPIAASLAFANKSGSNLDDGKWLVYDYGGGTFDVALTSIEDEEMKILDHEGDNYLGGTDFDRAVIDQFIIPAMEKIGTFSNLESEMKKSSGKYNRLYNKLLYIAEEAKIELTNNDIAEIEFDTEDDNGIDHEVYLELDKATFESIIKPSIDRTITMIREVMNRNQLSKSDLKCILLIGGTTYIPLVKKMLHGEIGLEVNSSMDPTTAVVVGAAYYAGIKPRSRKKSTSNTNSTDGIKLKLAYDRVVQSDTTLVICKIDGTTQNHQYRIIRKDGGYDTGMMTLEGTNKCYVSLVPDVYNMYELSIYDQSGNKITTEEIGITHGKFGIDGQPLPGNICLEVDAIEDKTTFLEPIFKKNAILPLKKTITKQISKTISKNSDDKLVIKVVEGPIDTLPSANKLIGMIEITGPMLERDLIKGSDIELTFEITESRDIKVAAFLSLTDQDFEDTFSPSELHVSEMELLRETKYFKDNLIAKRKDFEFHSEYEKAGAVSNLINDVLELEDEIKELDVDDMSDQKYKIEIRKRELGAKIHRFYNSSFLTKTIERYYEEKRRAQNMLLDANANDQDKAEVNRIVEEERKFLNEGNIATIKMKSEHLASIVTRIYNRDRQQVTLEDIKFSYNLLKYAKYKNQAKADSLIEQGNTELERENLHGLYNIVVQLANMKENDKNSNSDLFRSDGTGLK